MNLYESFKKSLKEGSWEDALRTGKIVNLGGKENYTPTDFKYDGDKVYYKNSALSGNTWAEHPNNIDKIIDHIKNSEADGFKATVIDEETSVEPVDMNKVIDNDMTIKELDDTAQWLYDYDRDEWDKFTDNELIELAKLCQITPNSFGRAYDDEVFDEMDKRGLKLHESQEMKEATGSKRFFITKFEDNADRNGEEVEIVNYKDNGRLDIKFVSDGKLLKDVYDNEVKRVAYNVDGDNVRMIASDLGEYQDKIVNYIKNLKETELKEADNMEYLVIMTIEEQPGVFTTKTYDKYDNAEQAEDKANELRAQGINCTVETLDKSFKPVDSKRVDAGIKFAESQSQEIEGIMKDLRKDIPNIDKYMEEYYAEIAKEEPRPSYDKEKDEMNPEWEKWNREKNNILYSEKAWNNFANWVKNKYNENINESESLKEAGGSRLLGGRYRTMSELRDLFKEYAEHFETKGNRIKGNTPEDSYNRGWELGKADAYKLAAFEIENNVDPSLLREAEDPNMNTTSLYIDIDELAKYAELYLQEKLGYANVYKEPGKQYTYMLAIRRDDDSVDKWAKLHDGLFNESEKLNEGNYGNIYLAEVGYNGVVGTCRGIGNSKEEAKENAFKLFKQDYPYVVEDLMQKEEYAGKSEIEAVEEYYGLNTFDMSSGAANESGSKLNEADLGYKEKLGGDPEDFISDIQSIKDKLNELDTDKFATKLAYEVWEQFDDTCDYQIQSTKDRFLNESYNYIGKDTGEVGRSDKSHMEHTFTVYDCFGEVETFKSKEDAEKYIEEHKDDDLYTDPEYGCENGPEFRIEEDDIEVNNKKIVVKDDLAESEKVKESEKTLAVNSWTFSQ